MECTPPFYQRRERKRKRAREREREREREKERERERERDLVDIGSNGMNAPFYGYHRDLESAMLS
jgi:hypothetical protein